MRAAAFLYIPAFLMAHVNGAAAQLLPPEAGVPLELAQARAASVRDLRYALTLSLPEAPTSPIGGSMTIRFTWRRADGPLVLDFEVPPDHLSSVKANGKPAAFTHVNGHIVVPAGDLIRGRNRLAIDFMAGDEALNRNDEFLYTLFVPARARLTFPCFDQPDLKARYSLTLTVPAGWQAVSNGAETRPRSRGRPRTTCGSPRRSRCRRISSRSRPASSRSRPPSANGRTFRMFHRETDAAKVARNRDAIFDLHARALAWLEEYTAIPYAFGKFDFVLIPSFQFGGMEHAGAILYNASSLLLDESATQNQLLDRANVIAHETVAHVVRRPGDDALVQRRVDEGSVRQLHGGQDREPSFPEVNHELRFLLTHYPSAYSVDRTAGTNAIRQPLGNLDEAGSCTAHHLRQGAGGDAAARDDHGRRRLSRRAARIPQDVSVRQRDLARSGRACWMRATPGDLAAWSRAWVRSAAGRDRPTCAGRAMAIAPSDA